MLWCTPADVKSQQQLGTFVSSREQQGFGGYYGVTGSISWPSQSAHFGVEVFRVGWAVRPSSVTSHPRWESYLQPPLRSQPFSCIEPCSKFWRCPWLPPVSNLLFLDFKTFHPDTVPHIWLSACPPSSFSVSSSVLSSNS